MPTTSEKLSLRPSQPLWPSLGHARSARNVRITQDHFPVHPCEKLGITRPLEAADVARCVRFILEQPAHVRIPVMMIMPGEQPM